MKWFGEKRRELSAWRKKIERRHYLHRILRRDISPLRYGISSILSGKFSSLLKHVSEASPKVIFSIFFFCYYYSFTPRCFFIALSAFVLFSFSIKGKNIERRAAAYSMFFFLLYLKISQWKQKQLCGMISLFTTLLVSHSLSLFNFLSR